MSERLLGIPRSLALFGLLGLAAALVLYGRGLGVTLPRYELSKAAIVARAIEFATAQGANTRGVLAFAQSYTADSGVYDQLVTEYGVAEIRERRRDGSLPLSAWRVRLRKDMRGGDLEDDPAGVDVMLDERGTVTYAKFHEATPKAAAPPRPEARRIAAERLAAMGIDLTGYEEQLEAKAGAIKVSQNGSDVEVDVDHDELGDENPNANPNENSKDGGHGKDGEANAPEKKQIFVWQRVDRCTRAFGSRSLPRSPRPA